MPNPLCKLKQIATLRLSGVRNRTIDAGGNSMMGALIRFADVLQHLSTVRTSRLPVANCANQALTPFQSILAQFDFALGEPPFHPDRPTKRNVGKLQPSEQIA